MCGELLILGKSVIRHTQERQVEHSARVQHDPQKRSDEESRGWNFHPAPILAQKNRRHPRWSRAFQRGRSENYPARRSGHAGRRPHRTMDGVMNAETLTQVREKVAELLRLCLDDADLIQINARRSPIWCDLARRRIALAREINTMLSHEAASI